MRELSRRLAKLDTYLPLMESNVDAFLVEVDAVTSTGDLACVAPILLLADDHCPLEGVMSTMLSCLESLPAEGYVHEFLEALPRFSTKSPYWCKRELMKVLSAEAYRSALKAELPCVDDVHLSALEQVLSRVDHVKLQAFVQELRASVSKLRSSRA